MRPIVLTQTGAGEKVAVTNYKQQDFKVGLGVEVDGTVNYTVQHTFDDPYADYSTDWATDATWFDNDDTDLVSATANQDGNYAFPIRGIKLLQNSGAGTTTMTILQSQ